MATSTNFGWTEPDDTDLVKNGAAAMRTLGNAIDSSLYNAVGKAAGKNGVINGGFDIWQRGTSFSTAANTSAYTADRWQVRTTGANMANTVSRQVTNDTTNLPNIQYCARVQRNSGQTGTSFFIYEQGFETINSIPFAGKTVTLSFYARAGANFSAASSVLISSIPNGTGTDQTPGVYTGGVYPTQNNTLTTTWQRFTHTYTVPTTATEIGIQLYYTPVGTASTNDYFEVTGVQLELGSTATPFSRAGGTIEGELAACQRYYIRWNDSNAYSSVGFTMARASTNANGLLPLPTKMRVAPTSVEYANMELVNGGTAFAISAGGVAIYTSLNSALTAALDITSTGMTTGAMYYIRQANNTAGYIGISAEL